jgi:hypothetical protein
MSRDFLRIVLPLAVLSLLSGCKYDGSFMHLDSNSGVPFFGLQLAVDSGSRPPKSAETNETDENSSYNLKLQNPAHSKHESRVVDESWPQQPNLLRVRH